MKFYFVGTLLVYILAMLDSLGGTDLEEPHDYTISFFQFDPKDIGVTKDKPKRVSKKDIKASDRVSNHTVKTTKESLNFKELKTTNSINSTSNASGNSSLPKYSDLEKVKEWKDITNKTKIEITNRSKIEVTNSTTNSNETLGKNSSSSMNNTTNYPPSPQNTTKNSASNNTATQVNVTSPAKRNKIEQKGNLKMKKQNVLNPNPSPSQKQAALNIQNPTNDIVNPEKQSDKNQMNELVYKKNTSLQNQNKVENAKLVNSQKLVKVAEEPKPEPEKTKDPKLAKLEKDKQRNREIQANAKKIHPIKNIVDQVGKHLKNMSANPFQNSNNAIHDDINDKMGLKNEQPNKKATLLGGKKPADLSPKKQPATVHDDKKSNILSHRHQAKKFLPKYKEDKKDHNLSFQIGSLKHPKHNLYPQCYKCGPNATYADCVKKSSKISCNKDLKNICYTRSTNLNKTISYEMGCADHNQCKDARAFPCKDGSKQCFTCCQFHECNASPHHGDYELDGLNLDELQLETHGATGTIVNSDDYFYLLLSLFAIFVLSHISS